MQLRSARSTVLLLALGCGSEPASALELAGTTTSSGATDGATGETSASPTSGHEVGSSGEFSSSSSTGLSTTTTTGAESSSSTGEEPSAEPLRIAVISDLNGSYGSTSYEQSVHAAVAAVVGLEPDLVLSTGDMVAGQQGGLDYEGMWAGFHAAVSDELAAHDLQFAITPGNHDASGYPAFALEREIFVNQWMARKPALEYLDDSAYPLRYSFVAGPALFISLDSTTVGHLDGEQMAWIEAQLEVGADQPTKILFGHVPLVPFAVDRETEIIGDPALEAMLQAHGVDLFISGHHHAYYPGRRDAVRYVSTSCLGGGPRALIGTRPASPRSILVIELDSNGGIAQLDALAEPAFDTAIARDSLPASVSYGDWSVTRDDL